GLTGTLTSGGLVTTGSLTTGGSVTEGFGSTFAGGRGSSTLEGKGGSFGSTFAGGRTGWGSILGSGSADFGGGSSFADWGGGVGLAGFSSGGAATARVAERPRPATNKAMRLLS